jgi:hypothetical protein
MDGRRTSGFATRPRSCRTFAGSSATLLCALRLPPALHRRAGRRFDLRQRPVLQRFQAVARDVEDVVAIGTLLAQRLQVVLQARQGIGQRVELAAVGHAMAPDQFALGIQRTPAR